MSNKAMTIEKEQQNVSCEKCHQSDQFDVASGVCRRCQPPSRAMVFFERAFRLTFLLLASIAALAVLIRVGSYMLSTMYKIFKYYMS
jgi:hypothetical protein